MKTTTDPIQPTKSHLSSFTRTVIALAMAWSLFVPAAFSASTTWTALGGSDEWNQTANWSDSALPGGKDVRFDEDG